ncbi:MAG: response regulator, partial [Deltaproteobacteria bacterium]|nr:response regulator [Deltaproteobacteria bacterium]
MGASRRILVVDDEQRNRNVLGAVLRSLGFESEAARDGFEALERIKEGFDLVLLDVMMPGMDGLEVARRIRQAPDVSDIPIIMVTILTGKEDRLRAVEAGANDFISKPIDKVELRVRMASLLKMKEAQDAIKRHKADLETEVRKRTSELRESEERLRGIFEAAQDCIFVQDRNLSYTHVNAYMARLFERPAFQLVGVTDEALFGE